MLEKLAAIANFADQYGEYEIANDLTQLVKSAQLFDALRTLFDPSTSELGPDDGWWKRLTRGWSRGKFDRRLGLALAINAERTKLNKKIEQLAAPLKDFSAQVSAFYDKVKAGGDNYGAADFKAELSQLKANAAKMKNLIGGRDLRKALDMRNRLNQQQIAAVEKIKGIDPEHKDFLIKLLNGEIKSTPQAGIAAKEEAEAVPGAKPEAGVKKTQEEKAIADWLKLQNIARRPYDEGFSTSRSAKRAAIMFQRYGFNPFAVLEFFKEHPEKKEEGVELFGHRLRKLFDDMNYAVDFELSQRPQKVEAPKVEVEPKSESIVTPPPGASTAAPGNVLEPKTETPKVEKPLTPVQEMARKHVAKERELAEKKEKSKTKRTLPEEKTQRAQEEISPIAPTTAARVAREITRLGRVRQLAKIAQNLDLEPLDDGLKPVEEEFIGLVPNDEDVYVAPEAKLETFDEEKDYDPTQTGVDMYHGEQEEGAMKGDPEDDEYGHSDWGWRNERRHREKQDTLNSLLSKMEQFGRLWREAPDEGARKLIQVQLDKLQAEYDRLEEKQKLEQEKKLPEGWVDDK